MLEARSSFNIYRGPIASFSIGFVQPRNIGIVEVASILIAALAAPGLIAREEQSGRLQGTMDALKDAAEIIAEHMEQTGACPDAFIPCLRIKLGKSH